MGGGKWCGVARDWECVGRWVGWGGVTGRVGLWGVESLGELGCGLCALPGGFEGGLHFHERWLFEMGFALLEVARFDEETDTDTLCISGGKWQALLRNWLGEPVDVATNS